MKKNLLSFKQRCDQRHVIIPAEMLPLLNSLKSRTAVNLSLYVLQRAEPVPYKDTRKFKDKYFLLPFKGIAPRLGISNENKRMYYRAIEDLIKIGLIVKLKTKTGRWQQYKMAPQWIAK